jgi:hypothetical protein
VLPARGGLRHLKTRPRKKEERGGGGGGGGQGVCSVVSSRSLNSSSRSRSSSQVRALSLSLALCLSKGATGRRGVVRSGARVGGGPARLGALSGAAAAGRRSGPRSLSLFCLFVCFVSRLCARVSLLLTRALSLSLSLSRRGLDQRAGRTVVVGGGLFGEGGTLKVSRGGGGSRRNGDDASPRARGLVPGGGGSAARGALRPPAGQAGASLGSACDAARGGGLCPAGREEEGPRGRADVDFPGRGDDRIS